MLLLKTVKLSVWPVVERGGSVEHGGSGGTSQNDFAKVELPFCRVAWWFGPDDAVGECERV